MLEIQIDVMNPETDEKFGTSSYTQEVFKDILSSLWYINDEQRKEFRCYERLANNAICGFDSKISDFLIDYFQEKEEIEFADFYDFRCWLEDNFSTLCRFSEEVNETFYEESKNNENPLFVIRLSEIDEIAGYMLWKKVEDGFEPSNIIYKTYEEIKKENPEDRINPVYYGKVIAWEKAP